MIVCYNYLFVASYRLFADIVYSPRVHNDERLLLLFTCLFQRATDYIFVPINTILVLSYEGIDVKLAVASVVFVFVFVVIVISSVIVSKSMVMPVNKFCIRNRYSYGLVVVSIFLYARRVVIASATTSRPSLS